MKQKKIDIKDITLFLLIFVWIIIPNLKLIKSTSLMAGIYEYKYMQIVGLIGIYIFVFTILKEIIKNQNRKLLIKELLPIIFLIGYLIWTFISCIFAENKSNAFYGDEYRKEGFITYIIYAGFFSCAFSIKSNKLKKYLINIFIIVAVTNALLIYFVNGSSEVRKIFLYKDIRIGVFYNQNHYGYYLLLATTLSNLFFILEKNKAMKVFYIVSYIILLYFLIINNTFGCYLAILITIVLFFIYCIYKRKYKILCTISTLIFIMLSIFTRYNGNYIVYNNIQIFSRDISSILNVAKQNIGNNETERTNENNTSVIDNEEREVEKAGSGRMKLWKYGIKIFLKNPILGYGADNLQAEYEKYNINQDRPHNLFIQLATTSGIPGLTLYICGIGLIIIRGFRKLKGDNEIYLGILFTIIAYLISAMFGNSMYYTSPYFFILLGMLYKEEIRAFQKNPGNFI